MVDLGFFDCNCYAGQTAKSAPLAFASVSALLDDMDYYAIQQAVVTHAAARDFSRDLGNSAIVADVAGNERLQPCWVLPAHPEPYATPATTVVDRMLETGVRVGRMFPAR